MHLLPSNQAVLRLAAPIRRLGERVLGNRATLFQQMGQWESEVEAVNLIALSATHGISAAMLARSSTSLLPAAIPLARASMEAGTRALWLLDPDDPFEREARWLVHLEEEVKIQKRLEAAFSKAPTNSASIRDFVDGVRSKLPSDIAVLKQVPKFDEMLKAIGMPEKCSVYAFLSQTVHATHHGTSHYRQNLGSMKVLGDFASPTDWWLPLSTIWLFLALPVRRLSSRCPALDEDLLPLALQEQFVAAQAELHKLASKD
jgi:hypothetical protein